MRKKTVKEVGAPGLIPRYWDDVNVKTEEDILFLGEITIGEMIISWERVVSWLNRSIKNAVGVERVNHTLSAEQVKRLRDLHKERERECKKISQLRVLQTYTEKKPALPGHRPYHWFTIGNNVICQLAADNFAEATIIDGTIYEGGKIMVCLTGNKIEFRFETKEVLYPRVMHIWEYQYLQEHPDFAKLWFGREVVL